jgi:hypothetical protein
MPGSARWLKPRAVCQVAASGLRLSGEQKCRRIGMDPTRPGLDTCWLRTPAWVLIKARVCSILEIWDPTVGGSDPIRGGGLDPILGVRFAHVDVLDQANLEAWIVYIHGSGTGPALSHGGPHSLLMPWSISLSLDTWWPRTRPCGGVRHCCWPRVVARGWGESWPGPTYSSFTMWGEISPGSIGRPKDLAKGLGPNSSQVHSFVGLGRDVR